MWGHGSFSRLLAITGLTALGIASLGFVYQTQADNEILKLRGYCAETELNINIIVEYTVTKCVPSRDREKKDKGYALIFISSELVFSAEAAKKPWLLKVAAATGKMMSDHPKIQIVRIFVSDVSTIKTTKKAFWFPGSLAQDLQRKMHAGDLSADAADVKLQVVLSR